MKTINVKSSIAGIRTILHAPLVRALLLLAVATCLFFGTAYSAENHTVENSTIVPVVNANVSHKNNPSPEQSHTPVSDRGPLSPALNVVRQPDLQSNTSSNSSDLTDAEREAIRLHTTNIEAALNAAVNAPSIRELPHKDSSAATASSSSTLKESFRALSSLVENSSRPKQVQKAILSAISDIFFSLEKKSAALQKDTKETTSSLKLFEDLLNQKDTKIAPVLNEAATTALNDISKPNTSERTQSLDQALNDVIEILRRGSTNEKSTALQRAVYRNWYLSIAQKTRTLRLNRLQIMLAEQRQIENFKTSSPQK